MKRIFLFLIVGFTSLQISMGQNGDLPDGKIDVLINRNTIQPDVTSTQNDNIPDTLKTDFPESNNSSETTAPILFNNQHLKYRTGLPGLDIQNSADQVTFPAFGGYYQIKSNIIFNPTDKLTLSVGGSLIRYDTPELRSGIHFPKSPFSTLKYGLQASVQYTVTNWINLQFYGQRLWYLRPKEKDAFIFMNPMFPQSEVGVAVSTQIKGIKIDLGPKTIINTESDLQNLNMINSKVSIGF